MKADWIITGIGGQSVIEHTGSKRCQLSGGKYLLWKGRTDFDNVEIIAEILMGVPHSRTKGGLLLRMSETLQDGYRLMIVYPRTFYIQKMTDGAITTLATAESPSAWNIYAKTRFRVDEWQLSVDEFHNGVWQNIIVAIDTSESIASGYAGIFGESYSTAYYLLLDNVVISARGI